MYDMFLQYHSHSAYEEMEYRKNKLCIVYVKKCILHVIIHHDLCIDLKMSTVGRAYSLHLRINANEYISMNAVSKHLTYFFVSTYK